MLIIGILTFKSKKNFMLSCVEYEFLYNLGVSLEVFLELTYERKLQPTAYTSNQFRISGDSILI